MRRGGQPWVLHLSYVKPHWPYMAPDPYHRRYRADQCLPVRRNLAELENAHPVVAAYRQHEESVSFSSDDCVRVVRPAYQGLIRQLDDHLGRLFDYMEGAGLMKNTLIVFTADHGDFLGDHWLGEKELFYDTVQRVPFIVMDPSGEADATRGQALDHMVESVDLVPTVLRALDAPGRRTGWKDASCRKCCMACRTASPGATACIRSWTTASARPAARQDAAQCPRLVAAHGPVALCVLAGRAGAAVRPAGRSRRVPGPGDQRRVRRGARGLAPPSAGMDAARRTRTTMSDEAVERATAHKRAGVYFGQCGASRRRQIEAAGAAAATRDQAWAGALACAWASGLSSRRRILPTLVRGRSSRNST